MNMIGTSSSSRGDNLILNRKILKLVTYLSQTSCLMRLNKLPILIKKVMRYRHILKKDLGSYGELKFLRFVTFRLIFFLRRLNSFIQASAIRFDIKQQLSIRCQF